MFLVPYVLLFCLRLENRKGGHQTKSKEGPAPKQREESNGPNHPRKKIRTRPPDDLTKKRKVRHSTAPKRRHHTTKQRRRARPQTAPNEKNSKAPKHRTTEGEQGQAITKTESEDTPEPEDTTDAVGMEEATADTVKGLSVPSETIDCPGTAGEASVSGKISPAVETIEATGVKSHRNGLVDSIPRSGVEVTGGP